MSHVSKPAKRTKRKNLLSKVKRSFDVFKSNKHENQYAGLSRFLEKQPEEVIDVGSEEEEENGGVVLVDDDDEEEVIDVSSEDHTISKTNNELTDNTDFISLKFSDSDASDSDSAQGDEEEEEEDDDVSPYNQTKKRQNTPNPWIKDHDHSTQREIADWLTLEIKDFVSYISPSREEIESRNQAVRRLRENIVELWPDCEVHVFGSYATDLYLPGSDIDMVIVSKQGDYDNRSSLYSLSSFLKKRKLAKNVEVVAKTKVPIIKFVETKSNIQVDVSFERTNGIEAAKIIRNWLTEVPALRELVLIVKQFLNTRKLNNVRLGGLGGYSTICLVYSFLKLHPRLSTGNIDPMQNLGVLLIEFFELYGRDFGYDNVAICVDEDNVCYLNKAYYPALRNERTSFALSIQDPSDSQNNISRGSFNIRDIKKAFHGAFKLLVTTCYELEQMTYKERLGKSILGNVIKYKGEERDFSDERSLVANEAMINDNRSIVSQVIYSEASSDEEDHDSDVILEKETNQEKEFKEYNEAGIFKGERQDIDSYMGLISESDDESDSNNEKKSRKKSIDKDAKREYWLQKGSALNY